MVLWYKKRNIGSEIAFKKAVYINPTGKIDFFLKSDKIRVYRMQLWGTVFYGTDLIL